MIGTVLFGLLAQAAAVPAPSVPLVTDPRLPRMAALYEEVCLKAFPNDGAIDRAMTRKGVTPLTPEQVRVTMNDDPARGWSFDDDGKTVLVFLELPPYHACSVRWPAAAGTPDLAPYRAVADPYMATATGWITMPPTNMDRGDIHISAGGAQRMVPSGGSEALYIIDQTITDPARRAAGETGIDRRLVHQLKEG
ncbi:NMCC_0638 family (lipo)protein [Sphingomonas sp.]|uniref:NMCC_0638 family (lipo)protein n=1 Tax=Sphingomonas sp. TaxID=28214 RepID=UPI003B00FE95